MHTPSPMAILVRSPSAPSPRPAIFSRRSLRSYFVSTATRRPSASATMKSG